MSDRICYRFWAKEEQPEGVPEQGLVIANCEEDALRFVNDAVGTHTEWYLKGDFPTDHPDLGVHHVDKAPKRSPLMSANDLFAMEPERPITHYDYDPGGLGLAEIDPHLIPESTWDEKIHAGVPKPESENYVPDDVSANVRVHVRSVYSYHGSRCCTLETVWYGDKPFGIYQVAGRPDHREFYITDLAVYGEALAYLMSLYQVEEDEEDERVIDPSKPLRQLTCFYGTDTMLAREAERAKEQQ